MESCANSLKQVLNELNAMFFLKILHCVRGEFVDLKHENDFTTTRGRQTLLE